MNSITPTATANNPQPALGSAMAELLTQVPPALADQIRDAWSGDLQHMFKIGLDAGGHSAFDSIAKHMPDWAARVGNAARSEPQLRVLIGGAS